MQIVDGGRPALVRAEMQSFVVPMLPESRADQDDEVAELSIVGRLADPPNLTIGDDPTLEHSVELVICSLPIGKLVRLIDSSASAKICF